MENGSDPAALPLVLIVEDDLSTRVMYREYLSHSGFRIIDAHNGYQALEKAREMHPQAIVTDLAVPGMDGFEVLSKLAEDPVTAPLPVIIVTSQILTPEQYQALTHARRVILKHELSPAVWQRVFRDAGLGYPEWTIHETTEPSSR